MTEQKHGFLASFDYLDATLDALEGLRKAGFKDIRTFGPVPEHHLEEALGYGESPVRVFTLVGALTGTATGFAFTIFSVQDWPLVTGGKPIVSIPAFVVIAFEMTILFGALATLIGLFINLKLPRVKPPELYDPEFSNGRFGLYVSAPRSRMDEARKILDAAEPVEMREDPEGRAHV